MVFVSGHVCAVCVPWVRANILIGCKFSTLGCCGSFTGCGRERPRLAGWSGKQISVFPGIITQNWPQQIYSTISMWAALRCVGVLITTIQLKSQRCRGQVLENGKKRPKSHSGQQTNYSNDIYFYFSIKCSVLCHIISYPMQGRADEWPPAEIKSFCHLKCN